MIKLFLITILVTVPMSSGAIDLSPQTKIMIEHPMIDLTSIESLGYKGNILELEVTGYKIEAIGGLDHQLILPKEKYEFSSYGLLELHSIYGEIEIRKSWMFDNEMLISVKKERISIDGDDNSLNILKYIYNDNKLIKVESEELFRGVDEYYGCFKFIFKQNIVHSRDCLKGGRKTHEFNDDYKVSAIEELGNNDSDTAVADKRLINIYSGKILKGSNKYKGNELIASSSYTYHDTGAINLGVINMFRNGVVTSTAKCTYDKFDNELSCINENVKPKNYNPIFGEFVAKSETRTQHIQENDEFGNPLSRESIFYKVESDKSETLLKKEYRTFTYKYYQ